MKLWFWNWSCQLIVSQLLIFLHPCCCMTQQHRFELARKAQKKCIAFLLFVEGRMQHLYYWMVGTCPLVLQIAWLSAPLYCGLWVLLCPWSALEQLCQGQLLPPASIGRNPALPFVLALECLLQTAAEGWLTDSVIFEMGMKPLLWSSWLGSICQLCIGCMLGVELKVLCVETVTTF